MRIVIDMQGAQAPRTPSHAARNALLLAQAIAARRGEHEVVLALSAFLPGSIEALRAAFSGLLPQENIRVWYAPAPVRENDPANSLRRDIAHRLRSAFLLALKPDAVVLTDGFCGFEDDAVTVADEKASHVPTLVLLHADAEPSPRGADSPAYRAFVQRHGDALAHAHAWVQFGAEESVPTLRRVASVAMKYGRFVAKVAGDAADSAPASWDAHADTVLALLAGMARPQQAGHDIVRPLVARIAAIEEFGGDEIEMATTAQAIAANHPEQRPRRLFVDISNVVQNDLKTGIQRVTRSVLATMLREPPADYEVTPVHARPGQAGFFHAGAHAQRLTGEAVGDTGDDAIDPQPGDTFLALDFVHWVAVSQQRQLEWMRNHGVRVFFVVYDLLPARFPHYFPPGSAEGHEEWLRIVARFDGGICISQAVQHDLDHWLTATGNLRHGRFRTGWFHLGADVENSQPSQGLPADGEELLARLTAAPTFLMVGTVEPRKGHRQVLAAFELLWADGREANLVIVGKSGWMMDEFAERARKHPELDRRLFWPAVASDEYLGRIYAASTALIAASECEGFGLPLIEAARHGLPIIARDIRVFREVAGLHGYYYPGAAPDDLAASLVEWLQLYRENRHPTSDGMPWQTWQQSTRQLLENIG